MDNRFCCCCDRCTRSQFVRSIGWPVCHHGHHVNNAKTSSQLSWNVITAHCLWRHTQYSAAT